MPRSQASWIPSLVFPLVLLSSPARGQEDCEDLTAAGWDRRDWPTTFEDEGSADDPLLPHCVFYEDDRIVDEGVGPGDAFGATVSFASGVAVIGASGADRAHVMQEVGEQWGPVQTLSGGCTFSDAVLTDGTTVLVGDPFREAVFCAGQGVVTFLRNDGAGWGAPSARGAPSGLYGYGYAFAVQGDEMLVGAMGSTPCFLISGPPMVLAYHHDGLAWSQTAAFSAESTVYGDDFGSAVDLRDDGSLAVIGAMRADSILSNLAGKAYVYSFDGSTWSPQAELHASDGASLDYFGRAVAIEGNLIAVGASDSDRSLQDAGAVYIFRFDGQQWVEQQILVPGDPRVFGRFGSDLALDGSILVVAGGGTIYVYRNQESSFRLLQKLRATTQFGLGGSLALEGMTVLAGAPSAPLVGASSGVVFVYDLQELALTSDRLSVFPGEEFSLKVCGGLPGARVILSIRGGVAPGRGGPAQGAMQRFVGVFDVEGSFTLELEAALGVSGSAVQFQATGLIQPGERATSNLVEVAFP